MHSPIWNFFANYFFLIRKNVLNELAKPHDFKNIYIFLNGKNENNLKYQLGDHFSFFTSFLREAEKKFFSLWPGH